MTTRFGKMPVQTATWPKGNKVYVKMTKKSESTSKRPETATLDKPLILDPKLLRKLDMTTLSKEKLMSIQNLIISPKVGTKKSSDVSSWEDDDSSAVDEPKVKRFSKGLNTTYRIRSHVRKGLSELFPTSSPSPLHGNRLKVPEKVLNEQASKTKDKSKHVSKQSKPVSPKEIIGQVVETVIPPPCCTCGRSEQPERLHSHPAKWQSRKAKAPRPSNEQENRVATQPKSSVRKPNPIKYRSGRTATSIPTAAQEPKHNPIVRKETFKIDLKKPEVTKAPPKRKISHIPVIRRSPNTTALHSPIKTASPASNTPEKRSPIPTPVKEERPNSSARRPRTVVCYICMREFGTTSLPLHEPHCLQRWERENALLPSHLQRPRPKKPNRSFTPEEWNEFAYVAAQAALVPCDKCGRTFQPDRLPIHEKACIGSKRLNSLSTMSKDRRTSDTGTSKEPCYLCGWMLSPDLLPNHEEACLAKWQTENEKLPPEKQQPLPLKAGQGTPTILDSHHSAPTPPSRRRMAVCYLCGREFGSASIRIHEPQCLKKWKMENEKLPMDQRRSEPNKPDIIYTSDGRIDKDATQETFWKSHLVQLVPCGKCGRTFNPDRVTVHEKACKGVQHLMKH